MSVSLLVAHGQASEHELKFDQTMFANSTLVVVRALALGKQQHLSSFASIAAALPAGRVSDALAAAATVACGLSLIHISEPTRLALI
eukprot:10792559-Alexandrium_andersonii.AAC.1